MVSVLVVSLDLCGVGFVNVEVISKISTITSSRTNMVAIDKQLHRGGVQCVVMLFEMSSLADCFPGMQERI